jgi:hypothetical protein
MPFNLEAIFWYLAIFDSVIGNLMIWFYPTFFNGKTWKHFHKLFPVAKGWGALYLVLVLWVGWILFRLGVLPW